MAEQPSSLGDAATRQFKTRAAALAEELGIDGVTTDWAEEIYEARSDWVHGASVKLFARDPLLEGGVSGGPTTPTDSDAFRELALLQDLLRAAIRRAVGDQRFRARFVSDGSVRDTWPV